ncbi:histidine kinase [Streptomyces polyrhachis]|uniref:histidine kinase n=1 Tax=Streptomyces polyrhachis TaxID=1282885 RepID=A0ABW2GR01_9ACTN
MTVTGAEIAGGGQGPPRLWWWERPRSFVFDLALGLLSAVECAVLGARFAGEAGVPVVALVLLGFVAGGLLVVRRRWPIAVVLVAVAILPADMGYSMLVVGLYTLAAFEMPRRVTGVLAGMSGLGVFVVTVVRLNHLRDDPTSQPDWVVWLIAGLMSVGMIAPPLLLGMYAGARRRLVESLRERADGLERELSLLAERAEERAEWARSEERTRIAREMHDVVAYRVSLMVVHAAALEAVAVRDPQQAVRNAALVGDMGRQALTELREMLGVLRTGDGGRAVPAVRAAAPSVVREAPLAARPAAADGGLVAVGAVRGAEADGHGPCLDELDALVGECRVSGMAVELSVDGESATYAAEVEQTVYRVVQEALTNVHKHAPGAKVQVRLAHRGTEVAVLVLNGPADGVAANADLPSGGNGLIGMKERVTALGGGCVWGTTDAGGFKVSAVLPASGTRG